MFKLEPMELFIYLSGILSIYTGGAYGAFGAIVYYLYISATQEKNPYEGKLPSFILMGFFVALSLDFVMQEYLGQRYVGLLLISGFLFLRILAFFSSDRFADFVLEKIGLKDKKKGT